MREQRPDSCSSFTRRGFLAATAALAVPAVHAAGDDAIRIGVVGCGSRGRGAAAQAIESSPNVRIIALADLFPDAIDETLAMWKDRPRPQYDVPRERCFVGWDAYKRLLETDVNYVILATPAGFRPAHIKAAIEAGRHVYAEKALAVDPVGVRTVLAAAELATRKGLGFVAGTWRRHDSAYVETIKRLRDGAIGRINAGQLYCLQTGMRAVIRRDGWSDVEWQIRNFPYFAWLSGDIIVDQHMHQTDIANWAIGSPPKHCVAVGGRQVRTNPLYGHVYDHFAVDFEYPGGVHVMSLCRQAENTALRVDEMFTGTRGWSNPQYGKIKADDSEMWRYDGPRRNPYTAVHADLIHSVRAGRPINLGKDVAEGNLAAIMGRMAAYTGKIVRWDEALKSDLDLTPTKLEFGPLPVAPVAMPGA